MAVAPLVGSSTFARMREDNIAHNHGRSDYCRAGDSRVAKAAKTVLQCACDLLADPFSNMILRRT